MGGGVLTAIGDLVASAAAAGVELEVVDGGRLRARGRGGAGVELLAELRARRDEVLEYLTHCVRCGSVYVAIRTWTADEPWCRSCAQVEGHQLLRAERPSLFEPGGLLAAIPPASGEVAA